MAPADPVRSVQKMRSPTAVSIDGLLPCPSEVSAIVLPAVPSVRKSSAVVPSNAEKYVNPSTTTKPCGFPSPEPGSRSDTIQVAAVVPVRAPELTAVRAVVGGEKLDWQLGPRH